MVSKLCLPISSALMLSGAGGMVSLTEAAAVSGSFLKVAPIDRCEALTSEASAALDRAVAQFSRPKAAGPARDAQGGEKATQPSWASRCSSSASYQTELAPLPSEPERSLAHPPQGAKSILGADHGQRSTRLIRIENRNSSHPAL
jgi:hypothetical protein